MSEQYLQSALAIFTYLGNKKILFTKYTLHEQSINNEWTTYMISMNNLSFSLERGLGLGIRVLGEQGRWEGTGEDGEEVEKMRGSGLWGISRVKMNRPFLVLFYFPLFYA